MFHHLQLNKTREQVCLSPGYLTRSMLHIALTATLKLKTLKGNGNIVFIAPNDRAHETK